MESAVLRCAVGLNLGCARAIMSSTKRELALAVAARQALGWIWSCLSEQSAAGGGWTDTTHATKVLGQLKR